MSILVGLTQIFIVATTIHLFSTTMSIWTPLLVGLSTLIAMSWAVGSRINKAMRRQDAIDRAVLNMHTAMSEMKTLQTQLTTMSVQLITHVRDTDSLIKKELRTNNGASIKDQITDTARKVDHAERALSGVTRDVAHVQATLNAHIDDPCPDAHRHN